jgi:tetratricopeptide (TPR) repeat protein
MLEGAKEYLMAFVAAVCPQCGGNLQVPDDRDIVKCMYCAVDVVVRQAIQLVPGNHAHLSELARSAAAAGNFEEAYSYWTKVLEIQPQNSEAWMGKGTAAGWLSKMVSFRFAEMLVAFENAIKFAKNSDETTRLRAESAYALNNVATAFYSMSRKHLLEFVTVPNIWPDYLDQCGQIINLYEAAHTYAPTDQNIIGNVIHLCKDNIEGVSYRDPYENNIPKVWHLSDEYEARLRTLLRQYADKLKALDPSYQIPNPEPAKAALCFVVTATMGREDHPAVELLRSFRDTVLADSEQGKRFIGWYYRNGPRIALFIQQSVLIRAVAFALVVLPAVAAVKVYNVVRRRV